MSHNEEIKSPEKIKNLEETKSLETKLNNDFAEFAALLQEEYKNIETLKLYLLDNNINFSDEIDKFLQKRRFVPYYACLCIDFDGNVGNTWFKYPSKAHFVKDRDYSFEVAWEKFCDKELAPCMDDDEIENLVDTLEITIVHETTDKSLAVSPIIIKKEK